MSKFVMLIHEKDGIKIAPIRGDLRVSKAIEIMKNYHDSLINQPLIELAEIICNSELS